MQDGLTTTLGVMSALFLAILIPLQYMTSPRLMQDADFRNLICKSTEFRALVMEVMAKEI